MSPDPCSDVARTLFRCRPNRARIKKAPGKYEVLGGRRTTRFCSGSRWFGVRQNRPHPCLGLPNTSIAISLTPPRLTHPCIKFWSRCPPQRYRWQCRTKSKTDRLFVVSSFPNHQRWAENRDLLLTRSRRIREGIKKSLNRQFHVPAASAGRD